MSTFSLNGYSDEELNSYIPALVYTLYDGFYIYSPYKNDNYRYDEAGNLDKWTIYTYDSQGRKKKATTYKVDGSLYSITTYTYNGNNSSSSTRYY